MIVAALGTAAAWLITLGIIAYRTRTWLILATPTTQPGPESPALAHFLTHHWECEGGAATATVLHLAARGAYRIEQIGPGADQTLVRGPLDWSFHGGTEGAALGKVQDALVGNVAPVGAIPPTGEHDRKWFLSNFKDTVAKEARALGLSRPRLARATRVALVAAAGVPALLGGFALREAVIDLLGSEGAWAAMLVAIPVWVGLGAAALAIRGERDTPLGRQAAARWEGYRDHLRGQPSLAEMGPAGVAIWGQTLAYAAALGVAKKCLTAISFDRETDGYWTAYGGTWRRVTVRYPRRPYWGRPPSRILAFTLIALVGVGAPLAYFVPMLHRVAPAAGTGLAATLITIIAWQLWIGVRALVDLVAPLRYQGELRGQRTIKPWFKSWFDDRYVSGKRYYGAVIDGRSAHVRAWGAKALGFLYVSEGDIVDVVVGRHFGYVRSINRVRAHWDWARAPESGTFDPTRSGATALPIQQLINPSDVATAFGLSEALTPSPAQGHFGSTAIAYQTGTATVTAETVSGETAARLLQSYLAKGRLIPGVGDEAYALDSALLARHGATVLYLKVASQTAYAPDYALRGLARSAFARVSRMEAFLG